MSRQSTRHILLIAPAEFYANPQTMETNVYQRDKHEPHALTQEKAMREFRDFQALLIDNGVYVTTVRGSIGCPDMLFPNWMSTHDDKGLILYPMLNENRRAERRQDLIDLLGQEYGLMHDLRDWEKKGLYVEATGSLCLDRANQIVYAALSPRTSAEAAEKWGGLMGYQVETFNTRSHTGKPVYHTDLTMWIGTDVAAVCAECILPEHRDRIVGSLSRHREIIDLTPAQQQAYCGNSLEVLGEDNKRMLVMSESAFTALTPKQIMQLEKHFTRLLHSPIPTIETYGGGSARCLMAELF